MRTPRRVRAAGVLVAIAALLTACGYDATELPKPPAVEADDGGGSGGGAPECDNATQSYSPSDDAQAARSELRDNGRLVAGVSADTFQMGWANPFAGNELQGFDIDLARAIAKALDVDISFRVISAAERIPLLEKGEIDIVARNMTMNCSRWEQIGFSAVYYNATQKVLVRADDVETFEEQGLSSLAGKRVCAPAGTTSIANIREHEPDAIAVPAANHTGCLVKFQNGEVDAITGDDTVLAGLAEQDPYARVPAQEKLTDEPYGIGVNAENVDLIRFINSVIEQRRSNGEWQKSYTKWLKSKLGKGTPPTPEYGR